MVEGISRKKSQKTRRSDRNRLHTLWYLRHIATLPIEGKRKKVGSIWKWKLKRKCAICWSLDETKKQASGFSGYLLGASKTGSEVSSCQKKSPPNSCDDRELFKPNNFFVFVACIFMIFVKTKSPNMITTGGFTFLVSIP